MGGWSGLEETEREMSDMKKETTEKNGLQEPVDLE